VSFYGDPDELDRLAKVLVEHAAAVRQATADQLKRAQAASWVSTAADQYKNLLRTKCQQAQRVASEIDAAAAILRGHAQQIRQMLAAIDRIEQAVTDWVSAVARKLEEALQSGAAGIGAPWLSWPAKYQPQSLPPPGDKGWLEVGRFLRSVGVM
jgi:hypothetical protein